MRGPASYDADSNGRVTRLPARLALLGDDRLARLVEGGSERAFMAIYDRYHQRLYRYTRSILHDGDDAHDALQSTLAGALAALQRGQRDAPLCPWLFRIAHNEAISMLRRRGTAGDGVNAAEQSVPSAEESAGERARLAALVADLRELPERQRSALLMHELSGLSHKEIASALTISVHTVNHAILGARRSLAEYEEGRLMRCEEVQSTISSGARALRGRRMRAHLRGCAVCAALAGAIPQRSADLQALFPALAPAVAASLVAHLLGSGSGHGLRGASMAGGASCKTIGATLAAKTLVGISIVAATSAGVTSALALARGDAHSPVAARTRGTAQGVHAARRGKPASQGGGARGKLHAGGVRGGAAGMIDGVGLPAGETAGGISDSSDGVHAAGNVGESWHARVTGVTTPQGRGLQHGGQTPAGSHGGGLIGRPGNRRHQPGGPLGLPVTAGHPAGPTGKPDTGPRAGRPTATPGMGGQPAGHPAPPAQPAPPARGVEGQPGKRQGPPAPPESSPASPPGPTGVPPGAGTQPSPQPGHASVKP